MVAKIAEGTRLSEISQVELFRLAALVYSEFSDEVSTNELLFGIIKSVFVVENNKDANVDKIIANVLNHYKIIITEDEILAIIKQHHASFDSKSSRKSEFYRLTEQELKRTQADAKDNIESYIVQFVSENNCLEEEVCRKAIYSYLYKLMTTNINSYQQMISSLEQGLKFSENDLFIDIDSFNDVEINYIKGFLDWDNQEKNTALLNVVSCCLEYCLLVAGDAYSIFAGQEKSRIIFIDTNIVFRVLGINGNSRQDVINSFLHKAKQAGIKIILTPFTKQEFLSTVEKSLSQISRYNAGEVYEGAYEQISDYNIYSYYYDWLENHKGQSIKGFRGFIQSALDKFIMDFDIQTNHNGTINIYSKESLAIRAEYEAGITDVKNRVHDLELDVKHRYDHDASLVYVAEETYKQGKQNGEMIECMIISTDKVLRCWDVQREGKAFPIVIYPSQLFMMLVKVCGRSTDDLKSFISFINVKNRSKQMSPEKANVVLAGIGVVTNDLQSQKILVDSVFNEDFQRVIRSSNSDKDVFEKVIGFGNQVLQKELNVAKDTVTKTQDELNQARADKKKEENKAIGYQTQLDIERDAKLKKDQKVMDFAKSRVKWLATLRFKIFPALVFFSTGIFIIFFILQLFYCDAEWNVVTKFIDSLRVTTFGEDLSGIAYVIDAAIAAGLFFLYKCLVKNKFFDKEEYNNYINYRATLYIKKSKL